MPDLGGVEVLEVLVESLKTWLMWNEWVSGDATRWIREAAEKGECGLELVKKQRESYETVERLHAHEKIPWKPDIGEEGLLRLVPDPPSTPGEEAPSGS